MKVLLADSRLAVSPDAVRPRLEAAGCEVVVNPHGRRLTEDELVALAADCDGVIAGSERYSDAVLARLERLRCVSRVGAGLDNVDLAAAARRGVTVRNTPDAPTRAVAEFTVGLMLALVRGIPLMDRRIRVGTWMPHLGAQLDDLRIGLVGIGRIGRAVAGLLSGWGAALYATDIVLPSESILAQGVRMLPLAALLPGVDVVSLHLPHTPHTHHLINARSIELMRHGAFLVNTSRGGLIDETALYAALLSERLGGAALDVFADEPYGGPLTALDTVILTSHAASQTDEARRRMAREAVENLLTALLSRQGELPNRG